MSNKERPKRAFDDDIRTLIGNGLRISLASPGRAWSFARMLWAQRRAGRVRKSWESQGTHVPPLAMMTVTGNCNLFCKGCYAREQGRPELHPVDAATLSGIIDQAHELGVGVFLVTGGEPLTRRDLLDITEAHPDMLFPMFTNGSLINDATAQRLAQQRHVVPLLSLEGDRETTDGRRGEGMYDTVLGAMRNLQRHGGLFGTSITLTRDNLDLVTSEAFIGELLDAGCRVFVYVNYIPVQVGTEPMQLAEGWRQDLPVRMRTLRSRYPALFVNFPGESEASGGCLAAGKGLIHIAPNGALEACPFSPYSDTNLRDTPLREALNSPLFRALRESIPTMQATHGSCLLWENRERVGRIYAGVIE